MTHDRTQPVVLEAERLPAAVRGSREAKSHAQRPQKVTRIGLTLPTLNPQPSTKGHADHVATAILQVTAHRQRINRLQTGAQSAPVPAPSPGTLADGSTLLPNGWRLAPAGRHLTVGDLPLNVVQSPDSRYLIITNNGLAKPSFSVVDVASWTIKNTTPLESAWYGLVWHPDGTKLYSAGAGQNNVVA